MGVKENINQQGMGAIKKSLGVKEDISIGIGR
jgi:hypothetical protein